MSRPVDVARLRTTLGSTELARLVDALQRRIELGRPLEGGLTLADASTAERAAVDTLFGRKSTRGTSLQIDLDELAITLRAAGICEDLPAAVTALRGPLVDRLALAAECDAAWSDVWRKVGEEFASQPTLQTWLSKLASSGVVRRLCGNNADVGAQLFRDLLRVVSTLPVPAEPLAAFAARLFGNAHALDPGAPRATLAVRAAARMGGIVFQDDAEGRRAAWAGVGVMCDELSTPALVFNLIAGADTPLSRVLRSAQDGIEPVHLSLRLLLHWPLSHDAALAGREVFICENPTIVTLAADRLGRRCAPLICANGQFATPLLVLLRQLRAAGARLRYHGDFDPPGLTIARRVMLESGAHPWRFASADYLAAPKGETFAGQPGATPWDESLRTAMRADGRAVHEEAVFESLAEDLSRGPDGMA
ncbi:MAG: TIGR02679 family protein [Opitutaceae bacterium]